MSDLLYAVAAFHTLAAAAMFAFCVVAVVKVLRDSEEN
jgi:hypothetical protein